MNNANKAAEMHNIRAELIKNALEEKQAEIDDLKKIAQDLLHALNNAESCETATDFNANMREARENSAQMLKELTEFRLICLTR